MTSRFVVFLSVVLTIWTLEHLYVGWRLSGLPLFQDTTAKRVLFLVMAAGYVSYIAARILAHHHWLLPARILDYGGGIWMGAVFLLLAAFLVVDITTLGGHLFGASIPAIRSGAAAAAVVALIAAWFGGLTGPRIVEVAIDAEGIAPTRILQVSDLHLSPVSGDGRTRRVIEIIDELEPDAVVLTGDLIDGDPAVLEEKLPLLRRFGAPLGVFAVLGNHEFYASARESRKLFRRAGYRVLDNASISIRPNLHIAGVPDARGAWQTGGERANLERALDGIPQGDTVVLLQHSPENETEAEAAGVDLMLSGHTHGGQVWPFHLMVRGAYEHIAGVRRVGRMTQVTSRGAGWWGPRLRLFAPADVVLVSINGPTG